MSATADLPVPDEARRAFAAQHGLTPPGSAGRRVDWDLVDRDIRAVAAPLIAAELRALSAYFADEVPGAVAEGDERYAKAIKDAARYLRSRADELAPVETDAADGRPV